MNVSLKHSEISKIQQTLKPLLKGFKAHGVDIYAVEGRLRPSDTWLSSQEEYLCRDRQSGRWYFIHLHGGDDYLFSYLTIRTITVRMDGIVDTPRAYLRKGRSLEYKDLISYIEYLYREVSKCRREVWHL